MTTQYTAGPWKDDGQSNDDLIVTSQWGEVARVRYSGHYGHRDANARLIAAAPDLLAALEDTCRLLALLNAPGRNDPIEAAVFKARAAIAKAKL